MTSNNGKNDFDVTFGRISFLQKILEGHENVTILSRHDDIVFEIERSEQGDQLSIVCVDEYSASLEVVMRVVNQFPETNIIFVGGKWNGYTDEARTFCKENGIGIYNAKGLSGALREQAFATRSKGSRAHSRKRSSY
ncbi:hypothetical protein [Sinorhizobium meliloti]|uniref:hypothetical protein n=1 Tax=Rhizobium meliloti TaxID=382 RepID=UPI000FD8DA52|nr:hypothetical protein [Sinorhizobium meliloti]RVG28639.1 hypothetical protein CN229_16010 [Sinorhizobium meliloti]